MLGLGDSDGWVGTVKIFFRLGLVLDCARGTVLPVGTHAVSSTWIPTPP